jgi:hypothetical protein
VKSIVKRDQFPKRKGAFNDSYNRNYSLIEIGVIRSAYLAIICLYKGPSPGGNIFILSRVIRRSTTSSSFKTKATYKKVALAFKERYYRTNFSNLAGYFLRLASSPTLYAVYVLTAAYIEPWFSSSRN